MAIAEGRTLQFVGPEQIDVAVLETFDYEGPVQEIVTETCADRGRFVPAAGAPLSLGAHGLQRARRLRNHLHGDAAYGLTAPTGLSRANRVPSPTSPRSLRPQQ